MISGGNENGKPSLVYIQAASHSGSTLTAMLLNAHPELVSIGELKATNIGDSSVYRCSCQEFLNDCKFWKKIADAMHRAGADFELGASNTSLRDINSGYVQRLLRPLHRGPFVEILRDLGLRISPTWRRGLSCWSKQNQALVNSVLSVSGARHIVDSSKIGIRLKYLIASGLFDIKVVRVVRDGRAVALTYMDPGGFADARREENRGGGSGSGHHKALSMQAAAHEWRRSNEEAESTARTLDDSTLMSIRYEQLCRDPDAVLRQLHRFIGVDHDDAYRRFKSQPHHVIGNGMRLDGSSDIVLDDRWKDVLGRTDLEKFDEIAGDLNRRYGFD